MYKCPFITELIRILKGGVKGLFSQLRMLNEVHPGTVTFRCPHCWWEQYKNKAVLGCVHLLEAGVSRGSCSSRGPAAPGILMGMMWPQMSVWCKQADLAICAINIFSIFTDLSVPPILKLWPCYGFKLVDNIGIFKSFLNSSANLLIWENRLSNRNLGV